MPASVPRTLADGMTILGLPGKIGNANTKTSTSNVEVIFLFIIKHPKNGLHKDVEAVCA